MFRKMCYTGLAAMLAVFVHGKPTRSNLGGADSGGRALPYEAEVEYLESTGTQYIDLNVNSTTDRFCDFDIRYEKSAGTKGAPYGYQYGASARYGIWSETNMTVVGVNLSNSVGMPLDGAWHTISVRNGDYVDIDGVRTAIGTGSVRANIGLNLFARVSSSSGATSRVYSVARVAYFVLYNTSGERIRDMVPVRKDGIGFMYDRVSGKLFGNDGTGVFAIGPDKR